ncbi:MAG: prephenate dehydrogenase [Dehalococcoidia bacterium]|nr:prephenate dehydrogenase [Dehalococcoidia bacterium]
MATERHRIAIIGLGQIGASIGMDMRGSFKGVDIIGHDKDPETAGLARRRGAVDEVAYTLPGAVEDAAIVIVAVPVTAVREVFTVISPNLSDGAIVTDTASTKMTVLQWAEEILPQTVDFVGGHPMAGVETPGIEGAQSGMFQGATWAIIPLPRTQSKSIDTIVNLVKTLGGEPYFADSVEHDSLVAAISHLPIALSINLMRTAVSSPSWREMARMAAGSFRDVSRLASGSVDMHHSIFATNKDFILHWIDTYVEQLQEMRKLVDEGGDSLQEALQEAYNARDAWLRGRVGETEQDRLYDEVPTASESAIGVFGGERLARIAGRFRRGRR